MFRQAGVRNLKTTLEPGIERLPDPELGGGLALRETVFAAPALQAGVNPFPVHHGCWATICPDGIPLSRGFVASDEKNLPPAIPPEHASTESAPRPTLSSMTTDTPAERAILRIREEMARKHLSQRDVAGIMGWTQSRLSKYLSGRIQPGVNELADLCFGVGISLVEAVRDHGLEFCADMTPTELRLLEQFRLLPQNAQDAILTLLHVQRKTSAPERHAGPLKKRHK